MRTTGSGGSGSPHEAPPEEPLELRRHLSALRRSRLLMALIVVPITALVLVLSLLLPKTYRASARIVLDEVPGLQSESVDSLQRRLATLRTVATTRQVLTAAAGRVRGEDADSLDDKVSASVDTNANLITISAVDESAGHAAAIANSVAAEFLAARRQSELRRLARARAALILALNRLRSSGGVGSAVEAQALRERLSELRVSEATAGSDLQLVQLARPPSAPDSPKPVRNTVFAFLAASFLAVLAALARAQFTPRMSGVRELAQLAGLPVLAGVPRRRARREDVDAERSAYQTLAAAIQMHLPRAGQQMLLVTSAVPEEGKTQVTARLGRELARAGFRTLMVSADLHRPMLHEHFGVAASPGLAEILLAQNRGEEIAGTRLISSVQGDLEGDTLALLPSGAPVPNPSTLLAGEALDRVFDEIERMDYRYVLVDGPPLLATVDAQALAMRIRNVVLVVRLDRVTPENVVDARRLLSDLNGVGLVVIGAHPPLY